MQKLTLYDYLAWSDEETQDAVVNLMKSKNYIVNPRNQNELSNCIAQFVNHEMQSGNGDIMTEIGYLHPDRDIILAANSSSRARLNADGLGAGASFDTAKTAFPGVQVNYPGNNNNPSMGSQTIIAGIFALALVGCIGVIISKS